MAYLQLDDYQKPTVSSSCGGNMIFKGVGEYQCEKCGKIEYDNYGKVRLYIEQNRGCTAAQIEAATGVRQHAIRQLLRESRIEVAENSNSFLHCEKCGASIRYGRFCEKCEAQNKHESAESLQKMKKLQGFGEKARTDDKGAKRFDRS